MTLFLLIIMEEAMTPTDSAIECVRWHMELVDRTCEENDLKTCSYYKWAATELLYRLHSNRGVPPLVIFEEFHDEMDEYSKKKKFASYIFSCGKNVTEQIIDMLIS